MSAMNSIRQIIAPALWNTGRRNIGSMNALSRTKPRKEKKRN
jgi:hypothetical protein